MLFHGKKKDENLFDWFKINKLTADENKNINPNYLIKKMIWAAQNLNLSIFLKSGVFLLFYKKLSFLF